MFLKKKYSSGGRAIILMYHHINELLSDEWQLAVSPLHFAQQLEVLMDYTVVSLQDLVRGIQRGQIPARCVAITFDDGYVDNIENAIPLLLSFKYPATFFLTNNLGDKTNEYWWDLLEYALLADGPLPPYIECHVGGKNYRWDMRGGWEKIISKVECALYQEWLRWAEPPTEKHALFVKLSEWMKDMNINEQNQLLDQLPGVSGYRCKLPGEYGRMSYQQVKALSEIPQLGVGGHSVSHRALGKANEEEQRIEIIDNKRYLETLLHQPIPGFAYPHGSYNSITPQLLRENGFDFACTTVQAAAGKHSDVFELPRVLVKDWEGRKFRRYLEEWFNN